MISTLCPSLTYVTIYSMERAMHTFVSYILSRLVSPSLGKCLSFLLNVANGARNMKNINTGNKKVLSDHLYCNCVALFNTFNTFGLSLHRDRMCWHREVIPQMCLRGILFRRSKHHSSSSAVICVQLRWWLHIRYASNCRHDLYCRCGTQYQLFYNFMKASWARQLQRNTPWLLFQVTLILLHRKIPSVKRWS